ncbi:MAG: 50S ribosomal protein L11 methyltransferase [Desulfobacter sp.]|nr:50S ribosomal protein L11 methyltransferase [Desulfobacter sp.]WDP84692.1 MAG: 50S ribosomal protein L11 methyltransferase [Desulfobacter sp.]
MIPFNRDKVLNILFESRNRLTASAYIGLIAQHMSISIRQARQVLKSLVNDQEIAFQDLYGSTYVMESFSKPVRVSDRFFIIPPKIKSIAQPHKMDIRIALGIAFGSGHHPTTRLSLLALDTLFFHLDTHQFLQGKQAGDIGTGSGVLAIAACLAGMDTCQAWEIDANAVSEARQNVAANRLEQRISIVDDLMDPKDLALSLLMANLRFPTLKQLAPLIVQAVIPGAFLVLSGIRSWETSPLVAHYETHGFSLVWQKDEKDWAVVIFKTTPQ